MGDNKNKIIIITIIVVILIALIIGGIIFYNKSQVDATSSFTKAKGGTATSSDFLFTISNIGGSLDDDNEVSVEGTVKEGKVTIGNEVSVKGNGVEALAIVTHIDNQSSSDSASRGDYCKIYLKGIKKDQLNIGQTLNPKTAVHTFTKFRAIIETDENSDLYKVADIFKKKPRIKINSLVDSFNIEDKEAVLKNNPVEIQLEHDIAFKKGDEFEIIDKKGSGNVIAKGVIREIIK